MVPAKIVGIESFGSWFYDSCMTRGCNKKLTPKDGLMHCDKCKRRFHQGVLKYRVVVRAIDQTSDAPLLIWDRECEELIGMLATSLHALSPQVKEVLIIST